MPRSPGVSPGSYTGYCDTVLCSSSCTSCSTTSLTCYSDSACSTSASCPVPSYSWSSRTCSEQAKTTAQYSISPDTSCTGVCPSGWTLETCSGCTCSAGGEVQNTGSTKCGSYSGCGCDTGSCSCDTSGHYSYQNTGSTACGSYSGCSCGSCTCYIDSYTAWADTKCGDGQLSDCTGACTPSGSCDTNDLYQCDSSSCYYKNVGTDSPDYPQLNVSNTVVYTGGVDFDSETEINLSSYLSQTNNEIKMYGGTTGNYTNFTIYGHRKVRRNLTFTNLTREQNPEYQSTVDNVYYRKPYNITNNWTSTAESIIWQGECDFGICDVNSGTVDSLNAGASQLVYTKFHDDKLEETWLSWKQATNRVTTAGGYAYISADLNITNNDSIVNFTNIYYENTTTFNGWSNDKWYGYFDINANNSKTISNAIILKKENVINVTINQTSMVNPYTDENIKWWYNTTWNNTDSYFTFSNISYTFILPSDCKNIKVMVNGTDQTTNSSMVSINGCNVTVFNITLGPGEGIDPDVYYETSPVYKTEGSLTPRECRYWGTAGIQRCYYDCPDCYGEIGYPVPWRKTVSIHNNSTITYYNITVSSSIPTSTKDETYVTLYIGSIEQTIDYINISEGIVNWTIDEIDPDEIQTYTLYISTIEPTVIKSNETIGSTWYMYYNITGPSDLVYNKIWAYTPIKTLVSGKVYDNTTGYMTDISTDSDYGPPSIQDTNGDGLFDWIEFVKPEINQINKIVISGTPGRGVICQVVNKTLTNAPVKVSDYPIWNWTVVCPNYNPIIVKYSYMFSIPVDSSDVYIDGIPTEPGFRTTPPYGPYVVLSGSLDPNTNDTHYIVMKTKPVTYMVKEKFPPLFYVGMNASIVLEVTLTNWATEDQNNVTSEIPIEYGRNIKVFDNDKLVASEDEVFGSYTLNVSNIRAGETRTVYISYEIPTAEAYVKEYRRKIINNTAYVYYPTKIVSQSYIPLKPLHIRYKIAEPDKPFICKNVKFVWLSDEKNYLSPQKPRKELHFRCVNYSTVEVTLEPLDVGGTEYIDLFIEEVKPGIMPPEIIKGFYDIIDFIFRKVKLFLDWITGLFT